MNEPFDSLREASKDPLWRRLVDAIDQRLKAIEDKLGIQQQEEEEEPEDTAE